MNETCGPRARSGWLARRIASLACATVVLGPARADLANPVILDNKPLLFTATVDISLLTPAQIVLGGPDPGGDAGNWSAVITQYAADGDGVFDDLAFELFHNIAPHPPLGEFGNNVVLASPPIFHNFVPGLGFPGLSGNVPHGAAHLDDFELTMVGIGAGTSRLTVKMWHTDPEESPLPAWTTFALLAAALLLLAMLARRANPGI